MDLFHNPNVEKMIKQMSPEQLQNLEKIYSPERDRIMGNKIRALYGNGRKKIVEVTGLAPQRLFPN